CMFIDYGLDSW
nr:immunoglobulin heavy chain junction region [Macaca mulatta]MOX92732.1 immunoglobulin heavy chain junction region [Macaca mulatta]MOX92931.1 immunoglobulin heavy chain junction region [Macaca mulatta]MOX93086.1 immunoglobulin heavy chain junction region [Macaca mulatta]MOX94249.1 immunoglobulin heavy chain junction region [Macaca mulatta]